MLFCGIRTGDFPPLSLIGSILPIRNRWLIIPITTRMAEKISAQLNEPVAATIAPVMIGPTAPPIFETVFCSPATIETLFLGATSPGKAQTCDAATVVPDFATHKRKTVINTESVNGAKPIQSAISKPIVKNSLRVAVRDSTFLCTRRSEAQPAKNFNHHPA